MSEHTKEPWVLFCDNKSKTLEINDGHGEDHLNAVVAWPGFDSGDKPFREKKANAKRIVACVNACEGIQTDDLARLMAENERLKKNAERYEWLKSKFSAVGAPPIYWNCEDFEPSENPLCGDTLDDAIDAALKGEPK